MEKIAFARLLTEFLAPIAGLGREEVLRTLSNYAEELEQLSYNWKYVSVAEKMDKFHKAQDDERDRLLAKVAAMTVKDDDGRL